MPKVGDPCFKQPEQAGSLSILGLFTRPGGVVMGASHQNTSRSLCMAMCVLTLDTRLRMGSHDPWLPQQNRNQWLWVWEVIWALLHPPPSVLTGRGRYTAHLGPHSRSGADRKPEISGLGFRFYWGRRRGLGFCVPPPTSLLVPSLWVIPVHQPQTS